MRRTVTPFHNLQKMAQGVPRPQIFYGRRVTVEGNAMETESALTVDIYSARL